MGQFESQKQTEDLTLIHIYKRLKLLDDDLHCVSCAQFSPHPEGLSFVIRIHLPVTGKEYSFPTVITPKELELLSENECIDVLFDEITKALKSVQVVKNIKGTKIIH
jgi:hypothetical protein